MQDPHRRVLVAADMESYSGRNNVLQYRAQIAFRQIMGDAAAQAGLDRIDWLIQQGGDGELAILPSGTSERTVVARLAPTVDRLLREHNQGLTATARIRLRLAVHQGLVHLDGANGFPSDAVVHVCRLIDSPQLKKALRAFPDANVALAVSDSLYHEVVEHYRDLRPEQFGEVRAEIPDKGFSATAWIYVPGENVRGAPPEPDMPTPTPTPTAGQTFSGITTHGPAQFGNHNEMRNSDG
ncbi:hypothetical protein AMIS_24170 [Actinoplanes missouriensis 431]|uniref:Guanylate cyclase domain-containing protein n=1 Tax=Actinoplanes missouriensis (strain ATCC 14538 / DSM 43046 / CBS 188.64 / JCM 3121 / NBRC 102363 / NCIMB 12654 / NRRL B-3342 / UNCC 431) TaxID=512565 RepID=I0H3Q0_ACTM4|nr:hypothetical protein [Actinoplanes missouriensis]BAL87637.1 hypothetical protein AMIS_24170 [Actinoplanes missouriensis 431]